MAAVPFPNFLLGGCDKGERNPDAVGIATEQADFAHRLDDLRRFRRRLQDQGVAIQLGVAPVEALLAPVQVETQLFQIVELEALRQRLAHVQTNESVDAATAAALQYADQTASGLRSEVDGEVGHHQDAIRLGHLAGPCVVVLDAAELGRALLSRWMTFSM